MNGDLVRRHCAAVQATVTQIRVSLELAESQLQALDAYARHLDAPRARVERPATCAGYKDEDCARLHDEAAIELGGMGSGPRAYMCRGCTVQMPAPG